MRGTVQIVNILEPHYNASMYNGILDIMLRVLTRILKIGVPETSFGKSRSPTM